MPKRLVVAGFRVVDRGIRAPYTHIPMTESATMDVSDLVKEMGKRAKNAARDLAILSTDRKNAALASLANLLLERSDLILSENRKDLQRAEKNGISGALYDRLKLTPERIRNMAEGVRDVISLPDPVGEEIERLKPRAGLDIRKVRVPLGVIGIIYESRPNVTIDCAILCLKSGNATLLRGGSEAIDSNRVLAQTVRDALEQNGLNADAVQLIPTTDRGILNVFLRMEEELSCIIPRGGEALIRFVADNATVPVIKHYTGVCNLYVHRDADPELAVRLAVNAKTQRPGVCNAIENLFIDRATAPDQLPRLARALAEKGVTLRVDPAFDAHRILEKEGIPFQNASEDDFHTEYLDLILSIRVVEDSDAGIAAINHYGSAHSDAIVTENQEVALEFLNRVDSATVYWNASTRFTDGFEFGLGAEIGISTDKLHARGPMGLRELCTYKYQIFGKGEILS